MKKRLFLAALCGALLPGAVARGGVPPELAAHPPIAAAKAADRDAVPDAYTATSQFQRIVVVRLKNQVDMLAGLRQAVAREKIKNAVILSGAGSLVSYHVHVVSNTTLQATEAFFQEEGPFDLLTTNGYILEGRVHAHISFANPQKALGGHLEPGTRVFTFAIITLGVLDDKVEMKRFDDQTWW
ncbi:MAG: DNA-binding protein [Acidobacteriia bacterium]|nr:DNA-binding protein [Terriglobia bacterium]